MRRAVTQWLQQRLLGDLLVNGLALVATKAKGVVLILVLARLLGVTDYGVWAQATVLVTLLAMLAGLGLSNAIVRFLPERDEHGRRMLVWTCVWAVLLVGGVLAAVVAATASPIAALLAKSDDYAPIFVAASVLVPLQATELVLVSVMRAHDRQKLYASAVGGADVVELLVVAVVAMLTRSLTAVVVATVAVMACSVMVIGLLQKDEIGWPTRPRGLRRLLTYSLPIIPGQLGDETLARGDRLIIGGVLGPAAAGQYSALYAIASIVSITSVPFINVLFPKAVRHGREGARRLLAQNAVVFAIAAVAQTAVLALLAGPLSALLLDQPQGVEGAQLIVALAGAGIVFYGTARILALDLYLQERTVAVMFLSLGTAALNVVANFALVRALGIAGAAWASVLAFAVQFLAILWLTRLGPSLRGAGEGSASDGAIAPGAGAGVGASGRAR